MTAGFLPLLSQMVAMSQKATVRTAGIVGDDLAINSKQLMGGRPDRKLPMVYAVAKGSFKNKFLFLIPTAMALSLTMPTLIMPALTVGGAYLCWEGIDKFLQKKKPEGQGGENKAKDQDAWEKRHVKKAIKTDLILSAEITAVSLWTVAAAPILVQLGAMAVAGIAMTVGVYGIVGGIIKMDDVGEKLAKVPGKNIFARAVRGVGKVMKHTAPGIIKTVGVIGTVAMFLVGGGMVLHGIPGGEHFMTTALSAISTNPVIQTVAAGALETVAGVAAGFVAVPFMKVIEPACEKMFGFCKKLVTKVRGKKPAANDDEDADDVAPAPAPKATEPVALNSAPDAKAALNAAAPPPVAPPQNPPVVSNANDNQSVAPEAKTPPVAPKVPGK